MEHCGVDVLPIHTVLGETRDIGPTRRVTHRYLSPRRTEDTSGISKSLAAKGDALASFSLLNS